MRLTAYWNDDAGEANFSAKEIRKLFAEHPMVTVDFLQDVKSDATSLYECALDGWWESDDERRRLLSKWLMTPEQLAAVARGKARIEGECATEARHSPAQQRNTPKPYSPPTRRKTPSYGAVIGVCGLVLVAVAFWIWG